MYKNMLKHIGIPTLLEIPSLEGTVDFCLDLGLSIIEVKTIDSLCKSIKRLRDRYAQNQVDYQAEQKQL